MVLPPRHTRTPRKTPRQGRSRETVNVLLIAAARVIEEEGYAHVTAPKVAAVAGVSIGSLYQYFPNVESLVAALVDRLVNEESDLLDTVLAAGTHRPLREAVTDLVFPLVADHHRTRALRQRLFGEAFDQGKTARWLEAEGEGQRKVAAFLFSHPETAGVPNLPLRALLVGQMVQGGVDQAAALDLLDDTFAEELVEAVMAVLTRPSPSGGRGEPLAEET